MSRHSQEDAATVASDNSATSSPFSSNFLDKDAGATIRRKIYMKVFFGGMVMTTIAMLAVFSIYWGALYKTPVRNLSGWIVDFDGGLIGQTVTKALTGPAGAVGKVTWTVRSASEFANGASDLSQMVSDEKVWVAIAINSAATSSLQSATSSAAASYNGSTAITVYANEARAENGYRALIRPSRRYKSSQNNLLQIIYKVSLLPPISRPLPRTRPTILSTPISYTIVNVHPFDVPVATAVTFVGLIYLLILSFFIVMIGNGAREALVYSALSPAFGLPVNRTFGHACGLALEAMLTLLTIRFLPFFLLTWVVVNVSVCFFPIEVLPGIFKYGYGFPFYNVSKAVRTIVFGTHNELGLNFGVLIAWTVLSCITFPLFQWIARRRDMKAPPASQPRPVDEKNSNDTA
ncbi:hypothetical protein DL96DRAFT_1668205 [Flagelloscypha sp. PMI_526]|nr:hypothetical protein DL96DRAFT_1668205 [Flagelloscypha sp. PMI_526]